MIKQVTWIKSSLLLEDTKVKQTNITTNLKCKVFAKVIKM